MTKPETRAATCNLQSKCEPQSNPREGDSNQSIGLVVRLGVGAANSADRWWLGDNLISRILRTHYNDPLPSRILSQAVSKSRCSSGRSSWAFSDDLSSWPSWVRWLSFYMLAGW